MDVPTEILHIPYKELPISSGMKRFFTFHNIPILEKLLQIPPKELLEMKWFNAKLYYELTCLLEEHGLMKDWNKLE
ncbi:hypothetical protein [Cytophaga aurantiaca]|uniref:hypothetical protein n=1 Tax=Cytophaga aurantiaca TaxID=29530 RepID=UPI000382D550|nr:hypothetical protein [Cytophaga aurantiaca]